MVGATVSLHRRCANDAETVFAMITAPTFVRCLCCIRPRYNSLVRLGEALCVATAVASVSTLLLAAACSDDSSRSTVTAISAGIGHTCALIDDGTVRCFGRNEFGQLGLGSTEPIGDDEVPSSVPAIELGERVRSVHAGGNHSCAIGESGNLYCWGQNTYGQLGRGDTEHIGDDELAEVSRPIDFGEPVVDAALGGLHTCVLLESGVVRCFGDGTNGQLGYANTDDIGDNEPAVSVGVVDVGGVVESISAGMIHTCAQLSGGNVVCWGRGEPPEATAPGGWGQLGYGHRDNIGDDEPPSSEGPVDVGGPVVELAGGDFHQCARLESGAVRCWGRGEGKDNFGQLGIAMEENIGDDEPASAAGEIAIGASVTAIASGDVHNCVITTGQRLRCFGFGGFGQLGYGNKEHIGDDELPEAAGDVPIDGAVVGVALGKFHTCALLSNGTVQCFGLAAGGELGYGSKANIGDDEMPRDSGPIEI